MFTYSTCQQLVINFQKQECLNSIEQQLLMDDKNCFYFSNSWVQLARLVKMSIFSEFYIAEEQRAMTGVAKVRKQRKKIKNISRKLNLFRYFVRTCISRFNSEEW